MDLPKLQSDPMDTDSVGCFLRHLFIKGGGFATLPDGKNLLSILSLAALLFVFLSLTLQCNLVPCHAVLA